MHFERPHIRSDTPHSSRTGACLCNTQQDARLTQRTACCGILQRHHETERRDHETWRYEVIRAQHVPLEWLDQARRQVALAPTEFGPSQQAYSAVRRPQAYFLEWFAGVCHGDHVPGGFSPPIARQSEPLSRHPVAQFLDDKGNSQRKTPPNTELS